MDATAADSSPNSAENTRNQDAVRRRGLRMRLFTALIGAFGFGGEFFAAFHDRRLEPGWVGHVLLGAIFLTIMVLNSKLLLAELQKNEGTSRKKK